VRLKSVQLGYNIPAVKKLFNTSARIYFEGTNLMSFSAFKLWDPEMGGNGLAYPINRYYNLGLQVSF
jgi:hypothetical protein